MDLRRFRIALLFIIALLSNLTAIAIELFEMMGELYSAAVANSLNPELKAEFTEIANGLNDPTLPWLMTIILGLNLLIPLMAISFNNRLSAWAIFILGSSVTAFGTFHGLEHAMSGAIYALILALITLTIPGVYGCILAYRLARSSRTGKTPQKEVQNV
ncbi:MAG: hypothetical protein RLZZ381_2741 [Cyanobacteriota bacterium]|jgi:hypothetical protein